MHIRWHGDFTPVPDKPFTPATAVFKVVVDGKGSQGQDWLRLREKKEGEIKTISNQGLGCWGGWVDCQSALQKWQETAMNFDNF